TYLRFEANYGVLTTKGFNIVGILIALLLVRSGWSRLPQTVRRHLLIALVVNVPLFLLFGFHDELRNLSMLTPGVLMIVAANISLWLTPREELATAREPAGNFASSRLSTRPDDRPEWAAGSERYQASGSPRAER